MLRAHMARLRSPRRCAPSRAKRSSRALTLVLSPAHLLLTSLKQSAICYMRMKTYSTREAAKKLGLHLVTIQAYIAAGKIPAPALLRVGAGKLRIWTDEGAGAIQKTEVEKEEVKPQPNGQRPVLKTPNAP